MPIHDFPVTETFIEDFGNMPGRKKFTYKVKALDADGEAIAESNIVTVHIKNLDCQYKYTFEIDKASYIKNGEEILFKSGKILLKNHRIYMPLKLLFDEMMYEAELNTNEKKMTQKQKDKKFEFWYSGEDFFKYNGTKLKFVENDPSVTVKLIDNILYVPMFPIIKLMDAYDIKLDPFNLTIDMTFDCPEEYFAPDEMVTRNLSMTLDTNIITVDSVDFHVRCGLRLLDQKTYLPVEFVLKGFGLKTQWEGDQKLHFYKWNYKNPKKKSQKFGTIIVGTDEIIIEDESKKLSAQTKMEDGILYIAPGFMQFFEVKTFWNGQTKTISFEMDVPADAVNGLSNQDITQRWVKFFIKGTEEGDGDYLLVNGEEYAAKPMIFSNGSTMIPIKYFAQAFGGDFAWKPEKKEMVIEMKISAGNGEFRNTRAVFHEGELEYEVDGEFFEMYAPAVVTDGEFYVPAKQALKHFGVKGTWNAEEKSMSFESPVEMGRKIKLKKIE